MILQKMNKTILLLLLCCFSLSTFAQTVIATGLVTVGTDEEAATEDCGYAERLLKQKKENHFLVFNL